MSTTRVENECATLNVDQQAYQPAERRQLYNTYPNARTDKPEKHLVDSKSVLAVGFSLLALRLAVSTQVILTERLHCCHHHGTKPRIFC